MRKLIAIVMMLLPMLVWGQDEHIIKLDASQLGVGYYRDSGIKPNDYNEVGLGIIAKYNEEIGFFVYLEGKTIADCKFAEGTPALIKLKNGEILTLASLGEGVHWTTKAPSGPWYHFRVTYPITSEQIDKISEIGIDKLRFVISASRFDDYVLTDGNNTFLRESISELRNKISQNKGLYDDF